MKLGIVGRGMIVRDLLSFIHNIQEIEIVHISGTKRSEETVKDMCQKHHIQRWSSDYEELLNDENVEVIYVAVPNHIHYEYAKRALEANKHVILEKPFTTTYEESLELKQLAIDKHLFLWEAITNQYLPNYELMKDLIKQIGDIKIINCNYSQYSSRYDAFKEGIILPAFDVTKAGGALMDLNIYNIHFMAGIFGKPQNIEYYPNIKHNIDTSGILILEYEDFKCVCIGAKDCGAPLNNTIQGDKGSIVVKTPLSMISEIELTLNKQETVIYNINNTEVHRMHDEFKEMEIMYREKDYEQCYRRLEESMLVSEIQTIARRKAGIIFEDDKKYIEA